MFRWAAGLPPTPGRTGLTTGGQAGEATHLVFVPVPGSVVFCACVLLIAACVVWFAVMYAHAKKEE